VRARAGPGPYESIVGARHASPAGCATSGANIGWQENSAGEGTTLEDMGASRLLIALGVVLIAAGVLIRFAGRLPFKLGRLPGDIFIQGKHSSFYFPLTTCILLSVAISLLLWAWRR